MRLAAVLATVALALLPTAIKARDLQMVDQRGRAFTLADLKGSPLVVTFVSAHCYDVCPLIDGQIAAAAAQARQAHLNVRFLTVTLDPERDSLHDMRVIANEFSADPRQWIIAGGSVGNIHGIMRTFDVTVQRGPQGFAEAHTTFVYLLDAGGTVQRTLLASSDLSVRVIRALQSNWSLLSRGSTAS